MSIEIDKQIALEVADEIADATDLDIMRWPERARLDFGNALISHAAQLHRAYEELMTGFATTEAEVRTDSGALDFAGTLAAREAGIGAQPPTFLHAIEQTRRDQAEAAVRREKNARLLRAAGLTEGEIATILGRADT